MGNRNTRSEYRKKSRTRRLSTTTNISVDTVLDQKHFHAAGESKENPFEKYIYPFENVIFEATGKTRLLSYCGAVRVRFFISCLACIRHNHFHHYWQTYQTWSGRSIE